MISTDLTASLGPLSYAAYGDDDKALQAVFAHNPLGALRRAATMRIRAEVASAGGVHPREVCNTTAGDHGFTLRMRNGTRALELGWDQGRWKVVGFELQAPRAARR